MRTAINFTREHALNLLVWRKSQSSNWGTWGNYPELPVSATYLQYDVNPCQVNFDKEVNINGEPYNCVTENRKIVGKNREGISFSALQSTFEISDNEINSILKSARDQERIALLKDWIANSERRLNGDDEYMPQWSIEKEQKVILNADLPTDEKLGRPNIFKPFGKANVLNPPVTADGRDLECIEFDDVIEYKFIRSQGSSNNRKGVYKPIHIPTHIIEAIETKVKEWQKKRVEEQNCYLEKWRTELKTLENN